MRHSIRCTSGAGRSGHVRTQPILRPRLGQLQFCSFQEFPAGHRKSPSAISCGLFQSLQPHELRQPGGESEQRELRQDHGDCGQRHGYCSWHYCRRSGWRTARDPGGLAGGVLILCLSGEFLPCSGEAGKPALWDGAKDAVHRPPRQSRSVFGVPSTLRFKMRSRVPLLEEEKRNNVFPAFKRFNIGPPGL